MDCHNDRRFSDIADEVDISDMFFDGELEEITESGKEVEAGELNLSDARKALNKKSGFVKVVLSNVNYKMTKAT